MSSEVERDARNQALFREVNERIKQLANGFEGGGHASYLCECGDAGCTEPMRLTRSEYAAIRIQTNRFAVLPEHENPATETVVERHAGYHVVETLAGEGSRIAQETDPRSPADDRQR